MKIVWNGGGHSKEQLHRWDREASVLCNDYLCCATDFNTRFPDEFITREEWQTADTPPGRCIARSASTCLAVPSPVGTSGRSSASS